MKRVTKNWTRSTLAERLAYVLKETGWSEAELARQIGANGQSTVQHWLRGRNKTMQPRFANALQDKHRWDARWLLEGHGDPRLPFVEAEKQQILDRVSALPIERLRALAELIKL
jgi:transcriptional regulator with XRE-family HTH domain